MLQNLPIKTTKKTLKSIIFLLSRCHQLWYTCLSCSEICKNVLSARKTFNPISIFVLIRVSESCVCCYSISKWLNLSDNHSAKLWDITPLRFSPGIVFKLYFSWQGLALASESFFAKSKSNFHSYDSYINFSIEFHLQLKMVGCHKRFWDFIQIQQFMVDRLVSHWFLQSRYNILIVVQIS